MNFQYFFFNTYPGYFLQMVPAALAVGIGAGMWKYRNSGEKGRSLWFGLLGAYLTGLVGVTLLLRVVGLCWYWLFYHQSGGAVWFFEWTYDFVPDFWKNFRGENLANMLMFVPFGVLYPLAQAKRSFPQILKAGFALVLMIELLQPVFGRAFDINDVILNMAGIAVSAGVFGLIRRERPVCRSPQCED